MDTAQTKTKQANKTQSEPSVLTMTVGKCVDPKLEKEDQDKNGVVVPFTITLDLKKEAPAQIAKGIGDHFKDIKALETSLLKNGLQLKQDVLSKEINTITDPKTLLGKNISDDVKKNINEIVTHVDYTNLSPQFLQELKLLINSPKFKALPDERKIELTGRFMDIVTSRHRDDTLASGVRDQGKALIAVNSLRARFIKYGICDPAGNQVDKK